MVKCDVCGKNTLMPERFKASNVCKVCFMKVNGPIWKYRTYEKYEDARHQCIKALEAAKKQAFPEAVLDGISEWFDEQTKNMLRCANCGEVVQTIHQLGAAKICKKCFAKINNTAWKETEYVCNEDVEQNRAKILKIATKNGFPQDVVDGINQHFDEKIQVGLIRVLDDSKGQILKVYKTHVILITKNDFNYEERAKEYGKAIKRSQPKESLINNGTAKMLARSVLTGGLVRTGINLATSAAIDMAADAIIPAKGIFKVVNGSYKIDYKDYDHVEFQGVVDNETGYIRFRSSKHEKSPAEDIVYFVGSNDGKVELVDNIRKHMEALKETTHNEKSVSLSVEKPVSQGSVADEILKFKQLLDMGAITQEEFDTKKKELLRL